MFTVVSNPLKVVKSYNYGVKRETRQPVPTEHLLHVPIIINKQTNKKGEKRIVITREGDRKKTSSYKVIKRSWPPILKCLSTTWKPKQHKKQGGGNGDGMGKNEEMLPSARWIFHTLSDLGFYRLRSFLYQLYIFVSAIITLVSRHIHLLVLIKDMGFIYWVLIKWKCMHRLLYNFKWYS